MKAKKLEMFEREREVLFNNAPCGYHVEAADGTIVNMNATLLRWLDYDRDEVIGKLKFIDLVSTKDRQGILDKLASLWRVSNDKIDLILITKNSGSLPVTLSIVNAEGLTQDPSKRLFSTIDNTRCHEALERIKTLDQELEAFTYSISHDLRAPLRSIDGYSKILQEDYASQLDDEGRRVLSVVMNNARRMGKLIDDLLAFGRLGRAALQPAIVNMTAMVQSIIQELQMKEPGRQMKIKFGELHSVNADPEMIRLAWFNLLENAFKYTAKKDIAEIEVLSSMLSDREVRYEVRDNGVGFDMQYAGKLFGVFQRLHKMQEFSGTGVGLAIVKRIVFRHGGRVWANAAVNGGATFYFTLPTEHENR